MKRQEMVFDPFQFIDKKAARQLTRRSDGYGLAYLGGHFRPSEPAVSWFISPTDLPLIPAMFALGIVLACLFAPMHECSHGTAFRTRWMNEAPIGWSAYLYQPADLVSLSSRRASHLYPDPGQGSRDGAAEPDDLAALYRAGSWLAVLDDISGGHHETCHGPMRHAGFLVRAESRFAANLQRSAL